MPSPNKGRFFLKKAGVELTETQSDTKKEPLDKALDLNGGNDEARLGFAPRSQSFALKPNGLAGSICSLSGLTHFRSCRPSANPPNSQNAFLANGIRPLKKEPFIGSFLMAGLTLQGSNFLRNIMNT